VLPEQGLRSLTLPARQEDVLPARPLFEPCPRNTAARLTIPNDAKGARLFPGIIPRPSFFISSGTPAEVVVSGPAGAGRVPARPGREEDADLVGLGIEQLDLRREFRAASAILL